MANFGVSVSALYSNELGVDDLQVLKDMCINLGFRRVRLMSYWSLHEPEIGNFDFTKLDNQINFCQKNNIEVSLCVGYRQPRWPESHQPDWARKMQEHDIAGWELALFSYITKVVNRYKRYTCVTSWQLENEALNRSFGENGNFSRKRLRRELKIVKKLDQKRPVIMSTSNSWGLPLRKPRPDGYGFSLYRLQNKNGKHTKSWLRPGFYLSRARMINLIHVKPVFIHELQCEPWGPIATKDMELNQQLKIMSPDMITNNIEFALATTLTPIDLWGAEWWYWLKTKHNEDGPWQAIRNTLYTV